MSMLLRALAVTALAAPVAWPAFAEPTSIVWMIFVDDLHADFRNTGRLRSTLKMISGSLGKDGDGYLIRTSGPSNVAVDLTEERARLDQAIKSISGNGLKPTDILKDADPKAAASELRYRGEVAMKAVREMIGAVEDLRYHRKGLIYISNGYPDGAVAPEELSEVADLAMQAGIIIFALDPRAIVQGEGLDPALEPAVWQRFLITTRDSLRKLAEPTGGFVFLGEQPLPTALDRIDRSVR